MFRNFVGSNAVEELERLVASGLGSSVVGDHLLRVNLDHRLAQYSNPCIPASDCPPSVLRAIGTRLYWPTLKIRSINCWVLYRSASACHVAPEIRACSHNPSAARSKTASNGFHPAAGERIFLLRSSPSFGDNGLTETGES